MPPAFWREGSRPGAGPTTTSSRLLLLSPRADLVPTPRRHVDLQNVSPMSARVCLACGEVLPSSARVDKTTCGPACRTRLYRRRQESCDGSVTPLRAVTVRSVGRRSKAPDSHQSGPDAAPSERGRVIPMTASGRSGQSHTAAIDDTAQQLALWLASVSAEAACETSPTPVAGGRSRAAGSPS